MNIYLTKRRSTIAYRILSGLIAFTFAFSVIQPPQPVWAQVIPTALPQGILNLPLPGTMVPLSSPYIPALVKGITVHPENPLEFDFIVDSGHSGLAGEALNKEATKLIKYFLATLTTPDDELWVNLSPYEKGRIIPEGLGDTEMGRDLLAQDYILKQLTASMMYPEDELGKKFWDRVYQKANERYGTTEIPTNTFNKVWIVPDKATVYEHESSAYVIGSHLKVMLEEDYMALQNNLGETRYGLDRVTEGDARAISGVSSEVVREILIPELEKEVNEGENFAQLRQVYNSMILAAWFKGNLRESLLGQVYVDQNKTKGVDTDDKQINQKIYDRYIESFKKGVYNYIKEDYDPATREVTPRKYFSGGEHFGKLKNLLLVVGAAGLMSLTAVDRAMASERLDDVGNVRKYNIQLVEATPNVLAAEEKGAEIVLASESKAELQKGEELAAAAQKIVDSVAGINDEIAGMGPEQREAFSRFLKTLNPSDIADGSKFAKYPGIQSRLTEIEKAVDSLPVDTSDKDLENLITLTLNGLGVPDSVTEKIIPIVTSDMTDEKKSEQIQKIFEWAAKQDGVKHHTFLTSLAVFGASLVGSALLIYLFFWMAFFRGGGRPPNKPSSPITKAEVLKKMEELIKNDKSIWNIAIKQTPSSVARLIKDIGKAFPIAIQVSEEDITRRGIKTFDDVTVYATELINEEITRRTKEMQDHYFGGNWKERKDIMTEAEARAKAREFKNKFRELDNFAEQLKAAKIIIFPEAKWVRVVADELKGSNISVGVQSLYFDPEGDLQTQIDEAVAMGATHANVAHSMHRAAGLTNAQANKIMKAILQDGRLIPWYTIEETGKKDSAKEIADAIDVGLAGIHPEVIKTFPTTVEPTVLISTQDGSGKVDPNLKPSKEDAQKRTASVREAFKARYGDTIAAKSNVGYGASVKSANSEEIFTPKIVKNALVGGASLETDEFFNTVINGMKGATSSPVIAKDKPGGIDLNPDLLDLQIKRDGNGVPLPLNMQPVETMRIEGFLPVIINVTPVVNLPLLLGLAGEEEAPSGSAGTGAPARPRELGFIEKYRNKYIREYKYQDDKIDA